MKKGERRDLYRMNKFSGLHFEFIKFKLEPVVYKKEKDEKDGKLNKNKNNAHSTN